MHVQELLAQARDVMTVKRVFGEPIEKHGLIIVPVANVLGGVGGGSGPASSGECRSVLAPGDRAHRCDAE